MAPKMIRRPAAAPRRAGALRRPAALEDGVRGEIPALREDLNVGDLIYGQESSYFGTACQFSGKVMEEWKDLSGKYYMVSSSGQIWRLSDLGERDHRLLGFISAHPIADKTPKVPGSYIARSIGASEPWKRSETSLGATCWSAQVVERRTSWPG